MGAGVTDLCSMDHFQLIGFRTDSDMDNPSMTSCSVPLRLSAPYRLVPAFNCLVSHKNCLVCTYTLCNPCDFNSWRDEEMIIGLS
ncbi:hypothetical protein JAAARDRAFT_383386 [Jaapia argillacea MUCL 33604]|uniref:Uncharacterized protein n=1 Tax=Jaapia argillacea MUCL 33604 TaxID=933084 RepID=A0A067QBP1_9AGAM|nr:hypothetical protein JAAARDRAFT_383386 [Jaapia argillacea MUCL 33604]